MKTMCPPSYHHRSPMETHALEHINHTSCAQVHEFPWGHCGDKQKGTFFYCFHDNMYIMLILIL